MSITNKRKKLIDSPNEADFRIGVNLQKKKSDAQKDINELNSKSAGKVTYRIKEKKSKK